ncbi:undifferentiated embryonic cell transcription factor 1 isoform 2-T2 [Sarcophilus harrisii]
MERSSPPGELKTQNGLKKPPTGSWRASWGRHETNLLLEAIFKTGKVHQIISGTSQRKSKLWREITETLAQRHVGYTAEQCRTKWKHLKSQFRFEQARYLTTGAHSAPLPHFYEKMSTLWKMAAGCSPKAGSSKRPKRSARAKIAQETPNENEEMPAPPLVKHLYDSGPEEPGNDLKKNLCLKESTLLTTYSFTQDAEIQGVLPGTWLPPPQAVTSTMEHQSKDGETSNVIEGVVGCAVNQTALGRPTLEETALQQEKPEEPCDPRHQQIGEAMLEELRNLSRTQQEMSVVNMYIAKVLQYQQEQLIPGIHLLNHNMYQLCLLLANQAETSLHPAPFLPQMINPSILLSGPPFPQPYNSTFEPPAGPPPK